MIFATVDAEKYFDIHNTIYRKILKFATADAEKIFKILATVDPKKILKSETQDRENQVDINKT